VKRALGAGFVVVITFIVGATVWSVASTMADGVTIAHSFDDHCSEPSDVVFPSGSCARVFRAEDFAAKRATLTLTVTRTGNGAREIGYTYENRTSTLRSFDWTLVELTTPSGERVTCAGDDTTQRYPAPPSTAKVSDYGCGDVGPPGRYFISYDRVEAGHLDVRSSADGNRVRATA